MLLKELMKLTEAKEVSGTERVKRKLLEPRGSTVVELNDEEGEELIIAVSYDFPEHAPTTKEMKSVLAPEFSKVTRQRSDRDRDVMVYNFIPRD
jgi:hypothetical protein